MLNSPLVVLCHHLLPMNYFSRLEFDLLCLSALFVTYLFRFFLSTLFLKFSSSHILLLHLCLVPICHYTHLDDKLIDQILLFLNRCQLLAYLYIQFPLLLVLILLFVYKDDLWNFLNLKFYITVLFRLRRFFSCSCFLYISCG